jgi:AhpD family alkylhydroperoxidase
MKGGVMGALTDIDRERVAVGAAIGAGCQPCTQHHVREALRVGLSQAELERTIEDAQAVRAAGSALVAATGLRLLNLQVEDLPPNGRPAARAQALSYIGAAAGCNAGALFGQYVAEARDLGLSDEEMRGAVEAAATVKRGAAMFLDREIERALPADKEGAGEAREGDCGCGSSPCNT